MSYTIQPGDLWDNVESANVGGNYFRASCGSRLIYSTDATSVTVGYYSDLYGVVSTVCNISIRVNGVDGATLACTGTSGTLTFSLAAGTKVVEVVPGITYLNSGNSASPLGTYLTTVDWIGGTTATIQAPTVAGNRLVVYGDSVPIGQVADVAQLRGWTALVRDARGVGSLVMEGYSSRGLIHDANGTTQQTNFANKLIGMNAPTYWFEVGAGDYRGAYWNPTSFQAAYGSVLDKLHAGLPNAIVYCQSFFVLGTETANSLGFTAADYRAAIAAAANARSSYARYVHGPDVLTLSDLSTDQAHPTTPGHAKVAANFLGVLNSGSRPRRRAFHPLQPLIGV